MILSENQKKYKLIVDRLMQRCQEIQLENERHVMRINAVKKIVRRRLRDVDLLKTRLDRYNDSWRSLPMVAPHPKRKIEQKRGPKPKNKETNSAEPKEKKARKQRVKKTAVEAKTIEPNATTLNPQQLLEQSRYQESQAQQLLMMQQRQINLKNENT